MHSESVLSPPSGSHRILIHSIGTATLSSAVAVARGLGLNAADVVKCLYKAPAILVDKVEHDIARHLARLLTEIGYEAEAVDVEAEVPNDAELFDVSLYLRDAEKLVQAAQKLAAFVGLTEDDAARMLLQPLGMALGSVSLATANAFRHFMGDLAEFVAAPQSNARYDLFLAECPPISQKRLLDDLAALGVEVVGNSGLVATGLDRSQADQVWQRHRTNTGLRIVHQAFLRFDVVLQPFSQPLGPRQHAMLHQVGIPKELVDEVAASAPVALLESIPSSDLPSVMDELNEAGLPVSAELITFQTLSLKITAGKNVQEINSVLVSFGIPHVFKRAPEMLPQAHPEIQARVLRCALEGAGAAVELVRN